MVHCSVPSLVMVRGGQGKCAGAFGDTGDGSRDGGSVMACGGSGSIEDEGDGSAGVQAVEQGLREDRGRGKARGPLGTWEMAPRAYGLGHLFGGRLGSGQRLGDGWRWRGDH